MDSPLRSHLTKCEHTLKSKKQMMGENYNLKNWSLGGMDEPSRARRWPLPLNPFHSKVPIEIHSASL